MWHPLLFFALLATFISYVHATALTYKLAPNEKACFFADVLPAQVNGKIAFYFAVQSGGSFDIDIAVTGPNSKQILSELKQRQGDYVFTAQNAGEYSFCFTNSASSFPTEKMVDMEIAIENESRSASLPQKSSGTSPEQHTALEEAVFRVSSQLSTVNRMQKYFRTRENRNFSTVRSTEGRIFKFSLVEVGMMVGMAGLQVLVVRFFFQGARKGYV
ncbi:hypothetical protein EPUS_03230 [Endocarpon pusillum Z07020]|uniref:GOLD domain-containing protein n=1 Tax=Endocarpon pusillum (strain Z07020 / HMAS-L-300199) TaxID=1263415 RepID=U1GS76_ENDPU|nr:uncharacterized protein EPUS_03230 [Endocarpon pusillum Z07020]ERF74846.1 hypothetical protein EPUS_03230 [Endocarpon pusillum Z07020]